MKVLGVLLVLLGIPGLIFGVIPGLLCIGVGALCIIAGK